MQNAASLLSERPGRPGELPCRPLPAFDRTEVASVRRAFREAAPCGLQQAWLDGAGFAPAAVRTGWRGNSLLVFAELTDTDIFNGATALNQPAWQLGDVFEMFLRPVESQSYLELQVTPNNHRLQLRYPDASAVGRARESGEWEGFLIAHEAFYSQTWVESGRSRWQVYAEIPSVSVCGSNRPLAGTQWCFSFSRYDYTRGIEQPVLSSTSAHRQPDFHRQDEWRVMTFQAS